MGYLGTLIDLDLKTQHSGDSFGAQALSAIRSTWLGRVCRLPALALRKQHTGDARTASGHRFSAGPRFRRWHCNARLQRVRLTCRRLTRLKRQLHWTALEPKSTRQKDSFAFDLFNTIPGLMGPHYERLIISGGNGAGLGLLLVPAVKLLVRGRTQKKSLCILRDRGSLMFIFGIPY